VQGHEVHKGDTTGTKRGGLCVRRQATVTLGKLIIFDSSKFTTIQKIIPYLIIGSLLLVLSFLYQKFRQTLFKNDDESTGRRTHAKELIFFAYPGCI